MQQVKQIPVESYRLRGDVVKRIRSLNISTSVKKDRLAQMVAEAGMSKVEKRLRGQSKAK